MQADHKAGFLAQAVFQSMHGLGQKSIFWPTSVLCQGIHYQFSSMDHMPVHKGCLYYYKHRQILPCKCKEGLYIQQATFINSFPSPKTSSLSLHIYLIEWFCTVCIIRSREEHWLAEELVWIKTSRFLLT